MSQNGTNKLLKKFNIDLNLWLYNRLKEFANENGMSIKAAVRYIINQHFKNKL